MTISEIPAPNLTRLDRLYIDGQWVAPSSTAVIDVRDSETEQVYFSVPEATAGDMDRAIAAARNAFDFGPWARLSHAKRAEFLHAIASRLDDREEDYNLIWPRESGVLHPIAERLGPSYAQAWRYYADLASRFEFSRAVSPTTGGTYGILDRGPVGVVGAIIPWNTPALQVAYKVAPALLAGCTVVLKPSPEAPAAGYLLAEIADEVGLPAGVLNVVTADREVSERMVTDPRVDKISFTGSTAAGRRIASLMGERIGRYTLELGGKSPAIILDDADLDEAASILAAEQCILSGQTCAALTRIIVSKGRHNAFVEALADKFGAMKVGSPFEPGVQLGPLASSRARDGVENYIRRGVSEGAQLATGGGRPGHLDRGYYVEPTVFGNVDNDFVIAREEIFGPVLVVIPSENEDDSVDIANDTIYGLNASVFTPDVDRAYSIAKRIRAGTVGHNALRVDFGMAFGGYKQSGVGREGGQDGLLPYLETKSIILDDAPSGYPALPLERI